MYSSIDVKERKHLGERLSTAAGMVLQALLTGPLLGLYWFFFTPENPLQAMLGGTFCIVTAWFIKKIIESWIRSRN